MHVFCLKGHPCGFIARVSYIVAQGPYCMAEKSGNPLWENRTVTLANLSLVGKLLDLSIICFPQNPKGNSSAHSISCSCGGAQMEEKYANLICHTIGFVFQFLAIYLLYVHQMRCTRDLAFFIHKSVQVWKRSNAHHEGNGHINCGITIKGSTAIIKDEAL